MLPLQVPVGLTVGVAVVGVALGPVVGRAVGPWVGLGVGIVVGFTVGRVVGLAVGFTVGLWVGAGETHAPHSTGQVWSVRGWPHRIATSAVQSAGLSAMPLHRPTGVGAADGCLLGAPVGGEVQLLHRTGHAS